MRDSSRTLAVTDERATAEAARDDLILHGISARVRPAVEGSAPVEDLTLRQDVVEVERGLGLGLVIGAVVGAVVVLVLPGLRALDPAYRVLVVGGFALQGTLPAVMWRLGRRLRGDDDPAGTRRLKAADWLVEVSDPHTAIRAHHLLERHPVVLLDPAPGEPVA